MLLHCPKCKGKTATRADPRGDYEKRRGVLQRAVR